MPLIHAVNLINKAIIEERKEKLYQKYLVHYAGYTKETFKTFDEFYEMCYPKADNRTKDDIMEEINKAQEKLKKKQDSEVKDGTV